MPFVSRQNNIGALPNDEVRFARKLDLERHSRYFESKQRGVSKKCLTSDDGLDRLGILI